MNDDIRQGLFFGLNSGVITTTGVISGLVQTEISKIILIVSIVSLAISDSASEAYGLYLSKKAEDIEDFTKGPLYSFFSLMVTKFVIVFSFLIITKTLNNIFYLHHSWESNEIGTNTKAGSGSCRNCK